MNKSWKINDTIQMYLSKERKEAIENLSTLQIKDVAQTLYDLYRNSFKPREAIKYILKQLDRQYNDEEFEKVCENDQKTIENIIGRVRQGGQQQQQNIQSTNQQNNLNDQTNNQQNQNDYSKKTILHLEKENTQQKNTILYYKDQIKQLQTETDKLIKLNNQLMDKILEQNNKLTQFQQQVQDKTNEFEIILLKTQLKSVNENSIKIPVDNQQQFKDRIDNLNIERDQIIKKMEDILKQFEQLQSRNTIKQNIDNLQIDLDEYQNIINQIKEATEVIQQMQSTLQNFEDELNLNLKNQNNQSKEILRDLIQKLKGNIQCFIYVKAILESTLKMLDQIKGLHVQQVKRNQELFNQLKEYQKENNKIKKDLEIQMNQLKQYNQKEQQRITNEKIKQNNQNCLDISSNIFKLFNKYANLTNEFNDQIMQEINNLQQIILVLFPNENINLNIQPNPQLVRNIQSFINNIKNPNPNNDNDSLEQQWQTSRELFKNIYNTIKISNNSFVNQYIYESFEKIQEIKRKILEYNKKINQHKQEIYQASQN